MKKLNEAEVTCLASIVESMNSITQGVHDICGGYGDPELAKIENDILLDHMWMTSDILKLIHKQWFAEEEEEDEK